MQFFALRSTPGWIRESYIPFTTFATESLTADSFAANARGDNTHFMDRVMLYGHGLRRTGPRQVPTAEPNRYAVRAVWLASQAPLRRHPAHPAPPRGTTVRLVNALALGPALLLAPAARAGSLGVALSACCSA